jgi:hypothetical protein
MLQYQQDLTTILDHLREEYPGRVLSTLLAIPSDEEASLLLPCMIVLVCPFCSPSA